LTKDEAEKVESPIKDKREIKKVEKMSTNQKSPKRKLQDA